jgi:hypothetical protein
VNIARWPLIAAAALLLTPARIDGITEVMTDADITRAFAVANGSESRRASFHAAYVVDVADAVIEHLEVITEFRRFVPAADSYAAHNTCDRRARDPRSHQRRDDRDLLQRTDCRRQGAASAQVLGGYRADARERRLLAYSVTATTLNADHPSDGG